MLQPLSLLHGQLSGEVLKNQLQESKVCKCDTNMGATYCWKVLNAPIFIICKLISFYYKRHNQNKAYKKNLETNWNVKPICDVRCLQQNLDLK